MGSTREYSPQRFRSGFLKGAVYLEGGDFLLLGSETFFFVLCKMVKLNDTKKNHLDFYPRDFKKRKKKQFCYFFVVRNKRRAEF